MNRSVLPWTTPGTNDTNYLTGLTIHTSDRDNDGDQSPKDEVNRTKAKPRIIRRESFNFDKMCSS